MKFIKFFVFGILAALGAMAVELILSALFSILFSIDIEANYFDRLTVFLVIAIFVEEFFKLILLLKLFSSSSEKSYGIMSVLFFGSGFALFEIFSKLLSLSRYDSMYLLSLSFLGVFLIHLITSGIIWSIIAKKTAYPATLIAKALFLAFLSHLIYNLLIIYEQGAFVIYAYLFSVSIVLYFLKTNLQDKKKSIIINTR